MTHRSVKRATGTTLALAASSTLLLTAFAGPAAATTASHETTVRVKVCKEVVDHHHHHRAASHGDEFDLTAETDQDWEDFTLADGDCTRFRLAFDNNRLVLEEWNADGYDVSFDVSGDAERVRERRDKVTVWIDEDERRPYIEIHVTNEKDHHHH